MPHLALAQEELDRLHPSLVPPDDEQLDDLVSDERDGVYQKGLQLAEEIRSQTSLQGRMRRPLLARLTEQQQHDQSSNPNRTRTIRTSGGGVISGATTSVLLSHYNTTTTTTTTGSAVGATAMAATAVLTVVTSDGIEQDKIDTQKSDHGVTGTRSDSHHVISAHAKPRAIHLCSHD